MRSVETGRPTAAEYAPHFEKYLVLVPEHEIVPVLEGQKQEVARALSIISEAQAGYRYAEGKWSIRQVVGHLVDTERIFGYRALCVARGEQGPLPGFDENQYVVNARFDSIPLGELIRELEIVREGNVGLFRHLGAEEWGRVGTANGKAVSVRALAFVMAGHVRHHLGIVAERYVPLAR